MRIIDDLQQSKARVRALRKAGYRVKVINLLGTRIVLKSKKPINCTVHHHCTPLSQQPNKGWPKKAAGA